MKIDIVKIVDDIWEKEELHSGTYKIAALSCIQKYQELSKRKLSTEVSEQNDSKVLSIADVSKLLINFASHLNIYKGLEEIRFDFMAIDYIDEIKDEILKEYKKGNIVVSRFEELQVMPIKEFIKQPTEGMLYDLNRNEAVVLTFLPNPKWVNDYAVAKVITELKNRIKELES